jgi:hypothetical protein
MYKLCWKDCNKSSWPLTKNRPGKRNSQHRNEPPLMSWLAANGCCKTGKATFKIIFVTDFLGSCILLLCFHKATLIQWRFRNSEQIEFRERFLPFRSEDLYSSSLFKNQNKPTLWSRVLLKKLIVTQLVKKFRVFYVVRMFITVFTKSRDINEVLCNIS